MFESAWKGVIIGALIFTGTHIQMSYIHVDTTLKVLQFYGPISVDLTTLLTIS